MRSRWSDEYKCRRLRRNWHERAKKQFNINLIGQLEELSNAFKRSPVSHTKQELNKLPVIVVAATAVVIYFCKQVKRSLFLRN